MEKGLQQDLKNSIFDGILAHVFATLTGGVFLTGFALYLGMNDLMIGLLASMPFVVTVFQLPVSYLARNGKRKRPAYLFALSARLTWLAVLAALLLPVSSSRMRPSAFLGLIFLSYAFASVSYVSWLSWMSDLVPDEIRGRFFGTRNMACGAAGLAVMMLFGNVLDHLNHSCAGQLPFGFGVTFLFAVLCGILGLHFLNRISEPSGGGAAVEGPGSFRSLSTRPFREPNFRRFLLYSLLWNFSVYFASPFFTLYFLRDLKYSYSFAAGLGLLAAVADMVGMHVWGRISDRVKNKAVVQLAGWAAVFLPLGWVLVSPRSLVLPVMLQIIGGGFWAGINLCTGNLLLRISPQQDRPFFLSIYHTVAGLGAASAPVAAGLILNTPMMRDLSFLRWKLYPIQVIFLVSTLLRLLSLQVLRGVREPEEATVGTVFRVLRSVRGLNIASGFNALLHPFVEIEKARGRRGSEAAG